MASHDVLEDKLDFVCKSNIKTRRRCRESCHRGPPILAVSTGKAFTESNIIRPFFWNFLTKRILSSLLLTLARLNHRALAQVNRAEHKILPSGEGCRSQRKVPNETWKAHSNRNESILPLEPGGIQCGQVLDGQAIFSNFEIRHAPELRTNFTTVLSRAGQTNVAGEPIMKISGFLVAVPTILHRHMFVVELQQMSIGRLPVDLKRCTRACVRQVVKGNMSKSKQLSFLLAF